MILWYVFVLILSGTVADLNQCALNIIYKYCETDVVYVVEGLVYAKFPVNASVAIYNLDQNWVHPPKVQVFLVIYSSNLVKIDAFLSRCYSSIYWRASVKVLIVGYRCCPSSLLNVTAKFYLANFAVLQENLDLYTLTPNRCSLSLFVNIGHCSNSILPVYTDRKQEDFKKCLFQTASYPNPPWFIDWNSSTYPGVIPVIQKKIQSALRYQLNVTGYVKYGVQLSDGSFTDMFEGLHTRKLDFFTGGVANETLIQYFDFFPNYLEHPFYFWVSRSGRASSWRNLLFVFGLEVWLSLFATLCTMLLSCWLLKSHEVAPYNSWSYCTLIVWKTIFSPGHKFPSTVRLKFTIFLWICAMYILTSAFQGCMNLALSVPRFDPQIATAEDILSANLELGGSYLVEGVYRNLDSKTAKEIHRKFEICPQSMSCTDRAANQKDFASIKDVRSVMYHWSRYLDSNGVPKLYWFLSDASVMVGTYTRKGHPAKEPMRKVVVKYLESGLIAKWDVYNALVVFGHEKTHYRYLNVQHLLLAFVFLLVGLAVSVLVFLVEIRLVIWCCSLHILD